MADLTDFGVEEEKPPLLERKTIINTPIEGKIAGFVCRRVHRGGTAYSTLRGSAHYYRKGNGYAISTAILRRLKRIGVSKIYVHKGTTDEDDVLEFNAEAYLQHGESVDPSDLENERDPQIYVPEDEAVRTWENHAADLHQHTFEEALDRITT